MKFTDSEASAIRIVMDDDHSVTISDMAYAQGTSIPTISKLVHGITYRDAVPSMCKRTFHRGRPLRLCPHQHRLGMVDKMKLYADRQKGESLRALGKKYHVSYQTVANYLKVM